MKHAICGITCLAMALMLVCLVVLYAPHQSLHHAKTNHVVIEIKKNQSLTSIAHMLRSRRLISSPNLFFLYVKLKRLSPNIQAGEYSIPAHASMIDVIHQLTQGKIYYRSIVFIEGWSFHQVRQALDQNPYLRHDTTKLSDAKIKQLLKDRYYKNLEGLCYPDTYLFARGTSDLFILKKSRSLMKKSITTLWNQRQKNLPYRSPYQSLIAASLIEKETAHHVEKPLIAGVIVARLKKGMKLQIDPTVIYALGHRFNGPLNLRHLKIKNRYNTYRYRGLPPTPIALPGELSIIAALHPKRSKYLFYRASGDGGHVFSTTFKQHKKAAPKNN